MRDGATGVEEALVNIPEESGTRAAARAALNGHKKGLLRFLPFLGPAFIACVAYIDPGNFATNIQGGSAFGYNLLWVIVLANLMAMLMQTMSAKLGLATGKNLAELSHLHFKKPVVYAMWIICEIMAMSTDLAEFLGASIAINLLFGIPLLYATLITGVATYLILTLERRGFRPLEAVIISLVGVIAICYVIETFLSRPNWGQIGFHAVIPWLGGTQSVLFSVGIIGATVMPHVIYLHSSLTQQRVIPRSEEEARKIFRWSIPDVVIAMGLAGLVNMAMLYMAAATFHANGKADVADINSAYQTLAPLLGGTASLVFAISLLASGLSSSTVGTMAGQVIMQGFVGFTIPVWLRRLVTMLPAILVAAIGLNPTNTLVVSQVVLSFVLPLPVITMIMFTRRRDLMGTLVNKPLTTWAAIACSAVILSLNVWLLYSTFAPLLGWWLPT
ncbi:divalent metal cation transporter [Ktedonosporobacter rubrisoli]|uniref:Divalent metal cation transporter MntH n=1 Tax=Ktedonosporobacter rubrisoli TaxID=2509675 RepID=A0A4V0Z0I6_KTERU|nr:divalent metal cation transporter [Ktedonosporobacter rubrisoli]